MKGQKGITLIALIITIIVMLILVGVSVSVALNTGLFKTAGDTAKNTQIAAEAETALSNGTIKIEGQEGEIDIDDYVESLKGNNGNKEYITTETSYIGYYADVDGNGTADGIIYADLAFAGNGTWEAEQGSYSYSYIKGTSLKDYYVSGTYNGKDVLSATTEGNDRFYVMTLEDFGDYTWYESEFDLEAGIVVSTSTNFGTGKANTEAMIEIWKSDTNSAKSDNDIWGQLEENGKWFVPSRDEWIAYADVLEISNSNYSSIHGLGNFYWTSSQDATYSAWTMNFADGDVVSDGIDSDYHVRLSTTF